MGEIIVTATRIASPMGGIAIVDRRPVIGLKRQADARADAIAAALSAGLDLAAVQNITQGLQGLRKRLETQLRGEGN